MTRTFAGIDPPNLRGRAVMAFHAEGDWYGGPCPAILKEKLAKDLKVEFSTENFDAGEGDKHGFGPEGLMGLVSLGNGLTFWGMCAGGDWEFPVYWLVYWDGRRLRAYVPTSGNPWNTKTRQAYGNDEEADLANARNRWPGVFDGVDSVDQGDFEFDPGAILNDILGHFKAKTPPREEQ